MTFKVFGETTRGRSVSPSHHATAEGALDEAVRLMTKGLINVHIIDPEGRHLTPTEFAKELNTKQEEARWSAQAAP